MSSLPFSKLIQNNNEYVVKDKATQAMIAQPFDENKVGGYKGNDVVTFDNNLYQFTSPHNGAWTGLDVEQVDIVGLLPFPNIIKLNLNTTITYKTLISNIVSALNSLGISDLSVIKDCCLVIKSSNTIIYRMQRNTSDSIELINFEDHINQYIGDIAISNIVISTNQSDITANIGLIQINPTSLRSYNYEDHTNNAVVTISSQNIFAEFIWR